MPIFIPRMYNSKLLFVVALPQKASGFAVLKNRHWIQLRRSSLNSAQGFLPWENKPVKILFTLKELKNRMELFQS